MSEQWFRSCWNSGVSGNVENNKWFNKKRRIITIFFRKTFKLAYSMWCSYFYKHQWRDRLHLFTKNVQMCICDLGVTEFSFHPAASATCFGQSAGLKQCMLGCCVWWMWWYEEDVQLIFWLRMRRVIHLWFHFSYLREATRAPVCVIQFTFDDWDVLLHYISVGHLITNIV